MSVLLGAFENLYIRSIVLFVLYILGLLLYYIGVGIWVHGQVSVI
jgi:hypothetical protein